MKCLHFRRNTLTSWPVTSTEHVDMTYYLTDLTLLLFLADRDIVCSKATFQMSSRDQKLPVMKLSRCNTNTDIWHFI